MLRVGRAGLYLGFAMVLGLLPAVSWSSCLPVGMPFDALAEPAPAPEKPQRGTKSLIFADASGGMIGFADPLSSTARIEKVPPTSPFTTVYELVPDILSGLGSTEVQYYRFGAGVEAISRSMLELAPTPVFYCPTRPPVLHGPAADYYAQKCNTRFNRESRIESAIAQISDAEKRDPAPNLAVVITDLFVSSTEMETGIKEVLRRSAGEILRRGLAVGVIGITAPFTGKMFDLPSYGPTNGPEHRGTRPFFLLVFGRRDVVEAFKGRLGQELGKSGAMVSVVFGDIKSGPAKPVGVIPKGDYGPPQFIEEGLFYRVPDLENLRVPFPLMQIPTQRSGRWAPIFARIGVPLDLAGSEAPRGGLEIAEEATFVYGARDIATCADRWQPAWQNDRRPLTIIKPDATGATIELFGGKTSDDEKKLASEFETSARGSGIFFLHRALVRWVPEVDKLGANGARALPGWVDKFSFRPDEERQVLGRLAVPAPQRAPVSLPTSTRGFFPALNLRELLTTLNRVEAEGLAPIELAYFVVAWRYEK